jgi:thiazole synthase
LIHHCPPVQNQPLSIADRQFRSRLMLGTGKFASGELMRDAIIASGTEIVTVALRRADLSGKGDPFANILDFIPKDVLLLPNTSGAMNAEEAVRLARLAVAAGLPNWVKLEIHPDPRYLLPDPIETLKAAEVLVKEGFKVLPYINADPVLARRLQDVGTVTVMPLGSPIGSHQGITTRRQIARTRASPRVGRSRSSSPRPPSRSSWMPESALPAMRRRPLRWARMPCW